MITRLISIAIFASVSLQTHGYTFRTPGASSYLLLRPQWPDSSTQIVKFKFRTWKADARILNHWVVDRTRNDTLIYEMRLSMNQTSLHLVNKFEGITQDIFIGTGLNQDEWHIVELEKNPSTNTVSIKLDHSIARQIPNAFLPSARTTTTQTTIYDGSGSGSTMDSGDLGEASGSLETNEFITTEKLMLSSHPSKLDIVPGEIKGRATLQNTSTPSTTAGQASDATPGTDVEAAGKKDNGELKVTEVMNTASTQQTMTSPTTIQDTNETFNKYKTMSLNQNVHSILEKAPSDEGIVKQPAKYDYFVSFGGMNTEQLPPRLRYIGRIDNILLGTKEDATTYNDPVEKLNVESSYTDKCISSNPCRNSGRCINEYYTVSCDCYDTGFEGDTCQTSGVTVTTLNGRDYMEFDVSNVPTLSRMYTDFYSIEFKTSKENGLLLHTYGLDNHILVTMETGGFVDVSIHFGNDTKRIPRFGANLNDNKWHKLVIKWLDDGNVMVSMDTSSTPLKVPRKMMMFTSPLYIGGSHKVKAKHFSGCLRNVYYNSKSLLLHIGRSNYHGSSSVNYGCHHFADLPISFKTVESSVVIDTKLRPNNSTLRPIQISFQFRTLLPEGVILFMRHQTEDDISLKVFLSGGILTVYLSEKEKVLKVTIGQQLHDEKWHKIQLDLIDRLIKLRLDSELTFLKTDIQFNPDDQLYLGSQEALLRGGFIGCIKTLSVNSQPINIPKIVQEQLPVGVEVNTCSEMKDACYQLKCKNGGNCQTFWNQAKCDCNGTGYEGRVCHFAIYKQTCDQYYQLGYGLSGVYHVDLDGNGPMAPTLVQCRMAQQYKEAFYGATIVDHNLIIGTHVRGEHIPDHKYILSYRFMSSAMLESLVMQSNECEQMLRYDCKASPLLLGDRTFFKNLYNESHSYYGGSKSSWCSCKDRDNCIDEEYNCNCDAGLNNIERDEAIEITKEYLPYKELVFWKSNEYTLGSANVSVGPLVCYGREDVPEQIEDFSVTFKTEASYLVLLDWKDGDLSLYFKAVLFPGVLLHIASTNNSNIMITVKNENTIEVVITINHKRSFLELTTHNALNDGNWHLLMVEYDLYNVRITVDRHQIIFDLPEISSKGFAGELYLGGKDRQFGAFKGFIGCIKELKYNGQFFNFKTHLTTGVLGVMAGCQSACTPGVCQNMATCIETWQPGYRCQCKNFYTHHGKHCEIDINEEYMITFKDNNTYLLLDGPKTENILREPIVFSFRTYKSSALLLYVYDDMNNFIQVHTEDGSKVIYTFNRGERISSIECPVKDLNDGSWKQVIIKTVNDVTTLHVDQEYATTDRPIQISVYSNEPFLTIETVKPERTVDAPTVPFVRAYVGGASENMTKIPSLHGCVAGLKIGSKIFNLQEFANTTKGVHPECDSGCDKSPCKNKGLCIEQWLGNFQCNCTGTSYKGLSCDKEAGVFFNTNDILLYKLNRNGSASTYTEFERIEIKFATTSQSLYSKVKRVMLALTSIDRPNQYLRLCLTAAGSVKLEINLGLGQYGIGCMGNFTDGLLHTVVYQRSTDMLELSCDGQRSESVLFDETKFLTPKTLTVGGMPAMQRISSYSYTNFSGCMMDVVFYEDRNDPNSPKIQPVDLVRGFVKEGHENLVIVNTPRPAACGILPKAPVLGPGLVPIGPGYNIKYTFDKRRYMEDGFPPWYPNETLEVIILDDSISKRLGEKKEPSAFDYAAIIAIAMLVIIIILALLIAALLKRIVVQRKRKRLRVETIDLTSGNADVSLIKITPREGSLDGNNRLSMYASSEDLSEIAVELEPKAVKNGYIPVEGEDPDVKSAMETFQQHKPVSKPEESNDPFADVPMIDSDDEEDIRKRNSINFPRDSLTSSKGSGTPPKKPPRLSSSNGIPSSPNSSESDATNSITNSDTNIMNGLDPLITKPLWNGHQDAPYKETMQNGHDPPNATTPLINGHDPVAVKIISGKMDRSPTNRPSNL